MAHRAFVLAQRLDVAGMNIQVLDLKPNSSQKSSSYDGDGQTFYMNCTDMPGTTHMIDNGYESGSRLTVLTAFYEAVADDTTGGGDDVLANQNACLGLGAYLRERVQPGGGASAVAGRMAITNVENQVGGIINLVAAGGDLTLAGINAVLSSVPNGGIAATDLDGAAPLSQSFGSVEDILRILAGEVYRSPMDCIICTQANVFLDLADREVLVAAQLPAVTGQTFVSQGAFLSNLENGYERIPTLAITGDMFASMGGGYLFKMEVGMTFKNPNFAYTGAEVTEFKPRAITNAGAAVPETGTSPVVRVYDDEGTNLL